ncbi:MAG: KEOPS complex subunit Cgi121 [Methanobacteriaceae archaeon]|nr:KEOPS complex subunit Cgi121 [Methanobacteriaceae archaeon]
MKNSIEIAGFKAYVNDLENLLEKTIQLSDEYVLDPSHRHTLQLLNADAIAGYDHILNAAKHALNAFQRGENVANDLGLEICLRASLQRQISKAITIMGLKEGDMNICAISINCNNKIMDHLEQFLGNRDDTVINPDLDHLKNIYGFSESEMRIYGSIENLMMERMAILILEI